jgi:serine/threonine protein kinase
MICYKCMREYTGQYCRYCGFNNETYEPIPTALVPLTVLHNQYIIGTVLGKGGFGITYTGYDNLNFRKVAIKEFFPSSVAYRDSSQTSSITVPANMKQVYENSVAKFYNEAVILSKLHDIPVIVNVYDFFYENNTAYIVMEFIDGTPVDKIVMNQGRLDVDMTLTIYYPIIQA